MTQSNVLIAVDGISLNENLRKKAQSMWDNGEDLPESQGRPRLKLDYSKVIDLLADPDLADNPALIYNYYTSQIKPVIDKLMGRVAKYWPERGYGFILGTDGQSYFFHNSDLVNKKAICREGEYRYPHPCSKPFGMRIKNKIVSFTTIENGDKIKAESVRIERGDVVDKYYQLRREPFLTMLEEMGFDIIRCRPQMKIVFDAMDLLDDGDDKFVLLSDDPEFSELIEALAEYKIQLRLVTFNTEKSQQLRAAVKKAGGEVTLIDDHIDDLQLTHEEAVTT